MKSQTTLPQESVSISQEGKARKRLTQLARVKKLVVPKSTQKIYDSILWRINAQRRANESLAVGLSGCQRNSGTSTIATNLAVQASSQHSGRVLLIDACLETSSLLDTLKLDSSLGLYDVLSGEVSPRECETQTVAENLDVLCSGKLPADRTRNVQQQLVEDAISEFKVEYDLILVDLPMAEELRNALPLARVLDGNLLIARFESVKQEEAQRVLQRLEQDGVPVWGSILNRHREYVPKWLQKWL